MNSGSALTQLMREEAMPMFTRTILLLGFILSLLPSLSQAQALQPDLETIFRSEVNATPTFFINKKMSVGEKTFEQFEQLMGAKTLEQLEDIIRSVRPGGP
jgi:predicted DsbA family dithiol-disulfide isomerase